MHGSSAVRFVAVWFVFVCCVVVFVLKVWIVYMYCIVSCWLARSVARLTQSVE